MASKKILAKLNKSDAVKYKAGLTYIQTYIKSIQGLKQLSILRSDRTLQSDYAEWLVSKLFKLTLSENPVQSSFDALDSHGKKYQIKCRVVKTMEQNSSFDFKELNNGFDYFLGVFFTNQYELLGVIKVKYEVVKELGVKNKSRISFRWNTRAYNDLRIKRIF